MISIKSSQREGKSSHILFKGIDQSHSFDAKEGELCSGKYFPADFSPERKSVLKLIWFAGCCTRTGQKAWLPLPRLRLNGWIWCKYIKQSTRFKDFSAIYKIHSFQQARIFPFFESGTRFNATCFSLQATKQNIKLLNFVL